MKEGKLFKKWHQWQLRKMPIKALGIGIEDFSQSSELNILFILRIHSRDPTIENQNNKYWKSINFFLLLRKKRMKAL